MSETKDESIFERVEVTIAELIVWIAAWQFLSDATSDLSKKTRMIVFALMFIIAIVIIIPVYKKRLRAEKQK